MDEKCWFKSKDIVAILMCVGYFVFLCLSVVFSGTLSDHEFELALGSSAPIMAVALINYLKGGKD